MRKPFVILLETCIALAIAGASDSAANTPAPMDPHLTAADIPANHPGHLKAISRMEKIVCQS